MRTLCVSHPNPGRLCKINSTLISIKRIFCSKCFHYTTDSDACFMIQSYLPHCFFHFFKLLIWRPKAIRVRQTTSIVTCAMEGEILIYGPTWLMDDVDEPTSCTLRQKGHHNAHQGFLIKEHITLTEQVFQCWVSASPWGWLSSRGTKKCCPASSFKSMFT